MGFIFEGFRASNLKLWEPGGLDSTASTVSGVCRIECHHRSLKKAWKLLVFFSGARSWRFRNSSPLLPLAACCG